MAIPEKRHDAADYESDVLVDLPDPDRIQVSRGTESAPGDDYGAGARVPSGPWSEPAIEDRKRLLKKHPPDRQKIRLVTPPRHIYDSFEELREAARTRGFEGALQSVSARAPAKAMRQLAECARDLYGLDLSGDQEILGGVRVNPAGLRTVTTHPAQGRFVGMHVDNWSMAPLESRHLAPIRICLNIGAAPRYFLFAGLTIQGIAEKIRSLPGFRPTMGCTDVARLFLSNCPSHAILRMKVMPGEAYIAPTEAIVHDGSTESATVPDLSLSIRESARPNLDAGATSHGNR